MILISPLDRTHSRKRFRLEGFTLAELLIAVAILGVIAAFTIPKVLQSQQNEKYKARAKEGAAMVATAYQLLLQNGGNPTTQGMDSLTPYMNYIKADSNSTVDYPQTLSSVVCGSTSYNKCLLLSNGSILRYGTSALDTWGGTNTTNALWFDIDPDFK